jgi:preprotein translocase subunit SecA
MAQGARISFDRKTHRQGFARTTRLRYTYLAAHLLESRSPEQVTDEVLDHLEGAQASMARVWGKSEWNRMLASEATLANLIGRAQEQVQQALGEQRFTQLLETPIAEIPAGEHDIIIDVLGHRVLSEIFRQLLLGVISDLWVDYLTRVEALRVSIGLEAYAQRDPLVQYKSRATEMFQELLAEVRLGVISRMFTFRPRQTAGTQVEAQPGEAEALPQGVAQPSTEQDPSPSHKKKRRRH